MVTAIPVIRIARFKGIDRIRIPRYTNVLLDGCDHFPCRRPLVLGLRALANNCDRSQHDKSKSRYVSPKFSHDLVPALQVPYI
jgi:hypothetical protein